MRQRVHEIQSTEMNLDVAVVQRTENPGIWSVEAVADDEDGSIYQAHFIGPEAERRAREYAAFKYCL